MEAEYYTIVIASNAGDSTRKLLISRAWCKAALYLSFALLLFMSTAAVDFFGLLDKAKEHRDLLAENSTLKEQSQLVEKHLTSVLANLQRTHRLTTKLKIITDRQSELTKIEADMSQRPMDTQVENGEDEVVDRAPSAVEPSMLSTSDGEPVSAAAAPLEPVVASPPEKPLPDHLTLSERAELALQESQLREQELMTTWGALSDRQNLLSAIPSIKPAHGYYSSIFGYRYDPINGRPLLHAGVDIAAPWGTPVLAPADGVVSFAGYEGGYGNLVAIDHGYGVTTRFGHNSRLFVHQGQHVHRWDVISAVGSTGHSTGAHVHYEVRVHGLPVNPANYILQDN